MMGTWLGTVQRKAVTAIIALGCSLGVSGCLTVKGTTTVLEDGRIIDQVQVLPKRSLWAIGTMILQVEGINADKPRRSKAPAEMRRMLSELRHGMEDTCVVANFIWGQPYAQQSIPVSATRIPLEFGIADMNANGCSIQIGPYDPRVLPPNFTADMGIRVVPLTGRYSPYKLLTTNPLLELDAANMVEIDTLCTGEIDPVRCRDDFKVLYAFVDNLQEQPADEELNFLERHVMDELTLNLDKNPNLLIGIMEIFRMVLKDTTVVYQLQDGAAVHDFTSRPSESFSAPSRGHYTREEYDWFWRGNMMDALVGDDSALTVRPTRAVGG